MQLVQGFAKIKDAYLAGIRSIGTRSLHDKTKGCGIKNNRLEAFDFVRRYRGSEFGCNRRKHQEPRGGTLPGIALLYHLCQAWHTVAPCLSLPTIGSKHTVATGKTGGTKDFLGLDGGFLYQPPH